MLTYQPATTLAADALTDERWPTRVWHADRIVRRITHRFAIADLAPARPDLWAAEDLLGSGGNLNLVTLVRASFVGNGAPARYRDLRRLDDCLRVHARDALVAYLVRMGRVPLPGKGGGAVTSAEQLSDLLLTDVRTGVEATITRIDAGIAAAQSLIARTRLGLELWRPDPAFVRRWDERYATCEVWGGLRRGQLYRENGAGARELAAARRTESFRLLERELHRATVSMPVPGGLESWLGARRPPRHPGLLLLQERDASALTRLTPARQGLGLLGTPEDAGTRSWLAPPPIQADDGGDNDGGDNDGGDNDGDGGRHRSEGRGGAPPHRRRDAAIVDRGGDPAGRPLPAGAGRGRAAGRTAVPAARRRRPPRRRAGRVLLLACRHGDVRGDPAGGRLARLARRHHGRGHAGVAEPKGSVHLVWAHVRNGEIRQPRRSVGGLRIPAGASAATTTLTLVGRERDVLLLRVGGGGLLPGAAPPPDPGFRYEIASDQATVVPQVTPDVVILPENNPGLGKLTAYPYFLYFDPGAPLFPADPFAEAITVACALRARCRPEAATAWYATAYDPMLGDNRWCRPGADDHDQLPRRRRRARRPASARRSRAAAAAATEPRPTTTPPGGGTSPWSTWRRCWNGRAARSRSAPPPAAAGPGSSWTVRPSCSARRR
nr:hypothetical protein GCM10020092_073830 [Actinoplanes digitatis]